MILSSQIQKLHFNDLGCEGAVEERSEAVGYDAARCAISRVTVITRFLGL